MFYRVTHDNQYNLYLWYDYADMPYRIIEVSGRRNRRLTSAKRQKIMSLWEKLGVLKYGDEDGNRLTLNNLFSQYNLHHIHPLSIGGAATDSDNLSLMPYQLHAKLHQFMQHDRLEKLLHLKKEAKLPVGKKVFLNVPLLPLLVSERDVPYLGGRLSSQRYKRVGMKIQEIFVEILKARSQKNVSRLCALENKLMTFSALSGVVAPTVINRHGGVLPPSQLQQEMDR